MGFLQEFKAFAVKGNVVDLAVAVVIGAAFGEIVTSLVKDIVMPALGYATRGVDFSKLVYVLGKNAKGKDVTIKYGNFIDSCLHFLIVSLAIFIAIKQLNRLKRKPAELPPATRQCPYCMEVIALKASKCKHCTADVTVPL